MECGIIKKANKRRMKNRYFHLRFLGEIIMNAFIPKVDNDKNNLKITDSRYNEFTDITDGNYHFGELAFTLLSEDMNKVSATPGMPYAQRTVEYDSVFTDENGEISLENYNFKTQTRISFNEEYMSLNMRCDSDRVSEWGLYLPFNMTNQPNGDWRKQAVPATIYHIADQKKWFCYLTRPDGNNLIAICENDIDGIKIDYCGFKIDAVRFLYSFDRALGYPKNEGNEFTVRIYGVSDFDEAVSVAAEVWQMPMAYFDVSACKVGDEIKLKVAGQYDSLVIEAPNSTSKSILTTENEPEITLGEYGLNRITPYYKDKCGADCSVYAYYDWSEGYKKACMSVKQNYDKILGTTSDGSAVWEPPHAEYRGTKDYNLCEHAMWCSAAIRYMLIYGIDEKLKRDAQNLLNIITTTNPDLFIKRCTIVPEAQGEIAPYNTFGLNRSQEAFNGAEILIDAYKLFGEKDYLELAINVLNARIDEMDENGCIYRNGVDYCTVTCMILPICDMAVLLKSLNDGRFKKFETAAIKMADHIVKRGFNFPTEGDCIPNMKEEGSMSCSALSVVYVCELLEYKKEYIDFAKQILSAHNAWVSKVPYPPAFNSTMRWWETKWEGDTTGPAICYGHAWTIWRAEADYYFGILTANKESIIASYNGYMSNFSKMDKDGNMYAIYQNEPISSKDLVSFEKRVHKNEIGFPEKRDSTLSRYAFVRAFKSWFSTTAVIGNRCLNGRIENNRLISYAPDFETLFVSDYKGTITFKSEKKVRIVTDKAFTVISGVLSEKQNIKEIIPKDNIITVHF